MAQAKKGLGRGLAALIPTDDMDFLSGVARGDLDLAAIAENLDPKTAPTAAKTAKNAPRSNSAKNSNTLSDAANDPNLEPAALDAKSANEEQAAPLQWLALDVIAPNPYQPRRIFDDEELQNLAASVGEHGILQPIIVRPMAADDSSNTQYQLVAGERRWRAAQLAGLTSIPAIVRPVSDQQALELAVIENVQRHDISPLDAAQAYRRLATEFELSQEKIAQRVGKSRSSIANTMRLLELPVEARNALQDGTISEGHGRAILLAAGEGARRAAFRAVLRDKLSVRDSEELARRIAAGDRPPAADEVENEDAPHSSNQGTAQSYHDNHGELNQLSEQMQRATGCRVQFRPRRRGGQFVIHCNTNEDATRLVEFFQTEIPAKTTSKTTSKPKNAA